MQVVMILHGIKTRGAWQKDLAPELALSRLIPYVLDYAQVGAFRLLWSGTLDTQVNRLVREYDRILADTGCTRPSVIAHSFGTLQIGRLLQKYDHVIFDKVILAAGILPTDYPWAKMLERQRVTWVLNDYGGSDFWPKLARRFIRHAGDSGATRFSDVHRGLHQVEHPYHGHSDYFSQGNFRHHWIPTLVLDKRSMVDDLEALMHILAVEYGMNVDRLRCSVLAEPQAATAYLEVVAGLHIGEIIPGELDRTVRFDALGPQMGPVIAFRHMREVRLDLSDLKRLRASSGKQAPWHQDLQWSLLLPVPTHGDETTAVAVLRLEGLDPPPKGLLEKGLIGDDTMITILRRLGHGLAAQTLRRKA